MPALFSSALRPPDDVRPDPSARAPASSDAAPGATLTIDLGAIAANYRQLTTAVAPTECAAVVKADAYGLGAAKVGSALAEAGCRTFFVASLAEGIALRAILDQPRIFVFEGPERAGAPDYLAHRLSPVLNRPDQIDLWRDAVRQARVAPMPCAVQIDTGMARLGLAPRDVERLAATPERLSWLSVALVMSHLACADEPASPHNQRQRERFEHLRRLLPPASASLANSAGCDLGSAFHFDLVRPGIGLYGGGMPTTRMRHVVRLRARILQVREIDRPESVGYGATHTVNGPTRIATLGLGYADGYKRSLSNRGVVALGGRLLPVVGRVSMDLVTVDVTGAPPDLAEPGACVEVLGPSVPLDRLAEAAGTIPHDVLTGLGGRLARRYVENEREAD